MSQTIRQQVAKAVIAVESKKAENIVILEMDRNSGAFTDYFLVCTGANPRQVQAITDEVDRQLSAIGQEPNSKEGYKQAEWVLLDYVHFVVHVFSERARKFYDLERLWKSAKKLKPADLLKPEAKRPAAKATAKKAPAKKAVKKVAARKTTKKVAKRLAKKKPAPKRKAAAKPKPKAKAKRKR